MNLKKTTTVLFVLILTIVTSCRETVKDDTHSGGHMENTEHMDNAEHSDLEGEHMNENDNHMEDEEHH